MKTIKLILLAVITFLLFFAGCMVNIAVDQSTVVPDEPSMLKLIAVAVLGIYEIIVRIVPSAGDYSVVSWMIKWLKKFSDSMNVMKK